MKLVYGIILVFFLPLAAFSQLDSLEARLQKATKESHPTQQALIRAQVAIELYFYDLERGLSVAKKALEIAQKGKSNQGKVAALTSIGDYYRFKGVPEKALENYREALEIKIEPIEDFPGRTYLHFGNYYRMISEFDQAESYYQMAEQFLPTHDGTSLRADLIYHRGLLSAAKGENSTAIEKVKTALAIHQKRKDLLRVAETQNQLGRLLRRANQSDSADVNFESAYTYAQQHHIPRILLFHFTHEAEVHFSSGNLQKAAENYMAALDILQRYDFATYKATTWRGLGHVFQMQGDYVKASEFFIKALTANEFMGVKQEMGRIYANLGWMFVEMENLTSAMEYALLSQKIMEKIGDISGLSFANNLLGQIYFLEKKYNKALDFYELSISQKRQLGNNSAISATLYNIARVKEAQGKTTEAIKILEEVVALQTNTLNRNNLSMTLNTLARILIETHKLPEAWPLLRKSEQLALEIGSITRLKDCYLTYLAYYKATNNREAALQYSEKYIQATLGTGEQKIASKALSFESLNQLQEKERLIDQLSKENLLRKNEMALQQIALKNQQMRQSITLLGLFLALLLAVIFYRYYRLKSQSAAKLKTLNEEITNQKNRLELQAEELQTNNELLHEQREEIMAQSEELTEANQAISLLNENLEKKVVERSLELEKTYRELDTFFYRASHDFRRPITTLKGLANLASMDCKDPFILDLFSKVSITADAMDHLIIKLQSFNLLQTDDQEPGEINIMVMIDDLLEKFRGVIREKSIVITTQCTPSHAMPAIYSYPTIVSIILENLLENAVQFSDPHQPLINIHAINQEDGLELTIHNNGEWIPEEYLTKVVNMYVKASERATGNGLGLFIVEKALRKLDGTIQIESAQDSGTTIQIFIPYISVEVKAISSKR